MDRQALLELYMEKIEACDDISDRMTEYFRTSEDKYLFGRNRQTAVCLDICRCMKVPIQGIILTGMDCDVGERKGYWKELTESVPVYSMEGLASHNRNAFILMTIEHEQYDFGRKLLKEHGFINIYQCEWVSNQNLKKICYEIYCNLLEEWKRVNSQKFL